MRPMRNISVARKFLWSFGLITLFCALLGVLALRGLNTIHRSTSLLAEEALPSADSLSNMRVALQLSRRSDMGILLCDKADCVNYYVQRRKTIQPQFEKAYRSYQGASKDAAERSQAEAVRTDFLAYLTASDQAVAQLLSGQKEKAASMTVVDNAKVYRRADDNLNKIIEHNTAQSRAECVEADKTFRSVQGWVLLCIVATVLASVLVGWQLTRSMAPPLVQATQVLEAVALKDLTVMLEAEGEDEIGRMAVALNNALAAVRELLNSMQQGVSTIASAATELSSNADRSFADAERQCSETTQIASATQQLAATIVSVSQNAEQANVASRSVGEVAGSGGMAIRRTAERMRGIDDFTRQTVDKMSLLHHRSEEIGNIVVAIREISEQTNLLALNAAIEAARAGEHGRGFAVVAGEVRRLAERTKGSTEEISATIHAIQQETRSTLSLMESGQSSVAEGMAESESASRTLDEIITMAQDSQEQIAMIATAATEEAAASGEISRSLASICDVSSHVSTAAEETRRASHELTRLAGDLDRAVGSFQWEKRRG